MDGWNGVLISPSLRGDGLVDTVFQYVGNILPKLVVMHAGVTLIVERMIAVLKVEDMVPDSCGAEMMDPAKCVGVEHCQLDIKTLRLRIWMSHEHARSSRPMAAQYMFSPLVASYLFVGPSMQDWILKPLNELDGYHMDSERYDHAYVSNLALVYTSEDEPMQVCLSRERS